MDIITQAHYVDWSRELVFSQLGTCELQNRANNMAADDMAATQGARSSAIMVLTRGLKLSK